MSKYLVAKKFFKNKRPSGGLYDAEIEYLESTGSELINTTHRPSLNTKMEFELMPLEYTGGNHIGFTPSSTNNNDNTDFRFFMCTYDTVYFDYGNKRIQCYFESDNYVWYVVTCWNNGVTINGETFEGDINTTTPYNCPIYAFGDPNAAVSMRLKYLKIYENDVLVQDLIPVRIDNIGYMYDKVSGKLFENQGSGNFILGPDVRYPEIEEPEETITNKFIVGKNHSENISQNNQFSVIKKQFKTKINLEFDSQGGTSHEQQEVILGETYGELPVPTKSQNIFIGWFTDPTSGLQIIQDSIVELDITKLYARWEYVQIDSDFTSYSVTTNSSYRNTGIYTASISDSSQPIYIDWGDGTVEKTNTSISQKSHTYKTNGNFTVKISNNITSFAPSYNNSTWYETTSQNRYTFKGMLTTGSKVTSIPTHAFYYCSAMANIDFMETCWSTITSLPDYCFCYCTGLTSIQGVKRFTSLGSYCFQYCSGLTGIQDLSEFKFTTLPNSYTFANCTNVIQWMLPNEFNGTSFGNYMFSNNSMLKYIGMKNYDISIEDDNNSQQLPYDAELEYLEYTANSGSYIDTQIIPTSKGKWELDVQVVSTSGGSRFLAACPSGSGEPCLAIAVPDSGTSWYAYKYSGNWNDPSMSIDTSVRHIVKYCFQPNSQQVYVDDVLRATSTNTWSTSSVTSIKMFSIPSGGYRSRKIRIFRCKIYDQNDILVGDFIPVRINNVGYMYDNISNKMFGNVGSGNFVLGTDINDINNINHTTSKLPESLTSTGTYTFQNCSNLKNIIIPSKVQSIGNYAFYGCAQLSNVNIEATNLTAINQYAFYNCSKLTDLDLPDTVKTIGNYAFYGCTSLDYAGQMANDLPYDAEIEYLESTGTQYIDSEINTISSIGFRVVGKILDEHIADTYPAIVGSFISDWSSYFEVYKNSNTIWCDSYSINGIYTIQTTPSDIKFDAEMNYYNSGDMHITDIETNTKKTSKCITPNINVSLGCFCAITENGPRDFSKSKIYTVKITNNKTLVRDFIPVRVGNVGYMYDKVSGQLFGNSGTGNFILGPDVKIKQLPTQLTSIGSYAYQGCGNLKSLNIPENLQTIGDYAFAGCYQISSIVDKRLTAQTVSTNTFGSATGTSNTAFTGYQSRGNNILSTYFNVTGYDENSWDDPLQNPDKCGFVQQYIDPENVVSCTVTFDAGIGNVSEASRSIIKGKKIGLLPVPTVTGEPAYFGGWSPIADDVDSIIDEDYKVTSDMTLYAVYSSQPFANYEVILNNQWQTSSKANPDTVKYDGVYESFSNYNIGSKAAVMYIKIKGYSKFTIYIRSYAESSYDYMVAFNLDTYTPSKPLTSNPSSSTSGVKAHTSGKQNGGTTIGSYTKVEYTGIDGKEHYICVAYRKDGSVNNSDDRGYVLVEKQGSGTFEPLKYINVNFEVGDGTLVLGETTTIDVQGSTLSRIPEISAPASKPYFVGWNTQADGSGEYYDNTTILPNQESLTLYAYYVVEDPIDPNKDIYLCFTAEQANSTVQLSAVGTAPTVYLETSRTCNTILNDWSDFVVGETTITLENIGDKIYFRAKQENNVFATDTSNYNQFIMTGKIAASGNINALLKADGSVVDLTGRDYCYCYMFYGCTSLTQVPALPAETLADSCYYGVFRGCTSLTQAPELPATALADYCYYCMFYGCTSLTQVPALPVMTLTAYCYTGMFYGCTNLTQTPTLPAITLTNWCYASMFNGCTSLTQAPELPAETLADRCYNAMFKGCTSLTQAPALPVMTLTTYCYASMFSGCTNLTQAPTLPATTLATYCYNNMFESCTNLTQAPVLPAETLAERCYDNMFKGCTSLIQGPSTLPATTLATYCYASMFSGCTNLTQAPELPAKTLATYCYSYMFYNCSSLTQAPELPATALADYCYSYMFYKCTSLTQAPVLPATTLANYCYQYMFYGCTSLTQGPSTLPAKTLKYQCYQYMFYNCSSLTQAPELPATTLAGICYSNMFNSCRSLTHAPELPAKTLAAECYSSMFRNCTSLTQAPTLPATALVNWCYQYMFDGCTNLNNINVNFSAWGAIYSTIDWVKNVSSSGTFTCPADLPETYGTSYIPTNWTIKSSYWGLCFTAEEPNSTIGMTKGESAPEVSLYTSIDGRTWTPFIPNETLVTLANVGDKIYFRAGEDGNITFCSTNEDRPNNSHANIFSFTGKIAASGNIMSLLNGDNPTTELQQSYTFANMFSGCTSLTQAPELPATTLADYCYYCMFKGCTALTYAPKLPATTLADYCYYLMFRDCSSLIESPELPSIDLTNGCYRAMLQHCTSITEAPQLPATVLTDECYQNMFSGCTSLTQAPELPAASLAYNCYYNMFRNCQALTCAPTLSANVLTEQCYQNMFYNCTSLTQAPELPATILTNNCYNGMFYGCSSLTKAPVLPTTDLITGCYTNMFANCTQLSSITTNILEWSQTDATDNWLANVSTTGTFKCYENLLQERGPNRIPNGWTIDNSITVDPNLTSYLCFTAEEPNSTIAVEKVGTAPDVSLKTTVNGIIWQPFNVGETTIALANVGDKVYFKANENDNTQFATSYSIYNKFVMTGKVAASGNIQSLLYKDEIINEFPATYCYTGLFRDCSALTQAPELPVEQLSTYCYGYMFNGCTSLSTPPVLSSTTIVNQCYMQMFANCSALTSAPELPATELKPTCYSNMFNGCTLLSTPPVLPATALSTSCYTSMFANCTSLTSTPQLPATELKSGCYSNMFKNCISLTSMPELPATTLIRGCYTNMFNGCTSLSSTVLLPATSLVATCYSNMFNSCSSLTSINVNLSAWNIAAGTTNWLSGVSDTGIFNCPASLPETRGVSNIPTNWEIVRK